MSFPLRIAALGLLLLTACAAPAALAQLGARPAAQTPGEPNPPTPQPANPPADWLGAYFTDPYAAGARAVEGGPDELLAAAIDQARSSVDMAIYDLNLWSVRDALLAAQRRGVVVRLVVEADNRGRREFDELAAAGIPIVADTSPNYMHNKFTIIDGYEVWTGSTNYTVSDMYGNRNNLLRLRSAEVAANYTAEFEEMFVRGYFGEITLDNTPYPQVTIADVEIQTYFSPDDRVAAALVDVIDSAEDTVYFLAFSITLDEIGDALVAAHQRGVEVYGVIDDAQVGNQGGEYEHLRRNGVAVYLDEAGVNLHDKVLIVDDAIVVMGSYNFSSNAERRNDENTLIIYSEALASQYREHFRQVWSLTER
ncbi:MAG: hypothetical protein KF828_00680 [Anaerolineales bacterium]|nr:hypothetical protein [Anaerolineales bacterium]